MDHLSTPFSREAEPGLIEEEELANLSKPSLALQSNSRAGIPGPSSDSSELDRASGSSNDIPGDEDTESITTLDEYYDARSEIGSIFSSRTLKTSFYRMASASTQSLNSVRSMLFAPAFGTLNLSIHELVQYLKSRHRLSKTNILDMTTYSQSVINVINHMFVVFRLRQGRWVLARVGSLSGRSSLCIFSIFQYAGNGQG